MKSVTDTFGYRTGDQFGAWSYHGLHVVWSGAEYGISWIAVPITGGLVRAQHLAGAQTTHSLKRIATSAASDTAAPEAA